jgi:hypothetical protein
MMNKTVVLFCLILFSLTRGWSVNPGAGEKGFPVIDGWDMKVSPDVYTPDNLWDLINGAAESYISYDFQDLHLADYQDPGGKLVHAEVYRHSSPDNAFGIYSSERSPDYRFIEVGAQGYLEEGILNFVSGTYYIKLYSTNSDVQEGLLEISRGISKHLGQENRMPRLLDHFPPQGRMPNTEQYVRENFIGFSFLHSAFTAEYSEGYRLFIILGTDRQEILEMARSYLKFARQEIDPERVSSFTIADRYNGNVPVVLKGSYMVGIINGADQQEAIMNLELLQKSLPAE